MFCLINMKVDFQGGSGREVLGRGLKAKLF